MQLCTCLCQRTLFKRITWSGSCFTPQKYNSLDSVCHSAFNKRVSFSFPLLLTAAHGTLSTRNALHLVQLSPSLSSWSLSKPHTLPPRPRPPPAHHPCHPPLTRISCGASGFSRLRPQDTSHRTLTLRWSLQLVQVWEMKRTRSSRHL